MTFHNFARKTSLLTAIEMTCSVFISFIIAFKVSHLLHFGNAKVSGLWSGISAIVVMEVSIEEAKRAASLRILGSLFGAICAYMVAAITGYTLLAMAVAMFSTTVILSLLNMKKTLRLSNLTALVIIVVGMIDPACPPWNNALARLLESLLGVSVTFCLVWLFYPIRKKYNLFRRD